MQYDFILAGCDFITNMVPHTILDFHRLHSPSVTTLYYEKNLKTEAPASKASEAGM
jgi:translation initiation factor eIF-2B subunit gamma